VNRLRSFPFFLVVAVSFFLVVALYQPKVNPVEDRISHLTHIVRCPSCEALSVAQSNATSSLAIRREIAEKVRSGISDTEILTSLQVRYGERILLSPPSRGVGVILWVVPVGVLIAGAFVVVTVSRRAAQ
jgi:cytochrome c-type biogenesis protein CcmH